MRLWPFRRKALSADSGVLEALRERDWSPYPLLGGGSRQRIQEAYSTAQSANYAWMYTNSPAVRIVVDAVVRNVGQLDLRLYEEIDEAERQARPEHPAALSLRYPSSSTPSDRFVRSLFLDFLTFGNAYALMLPANGGQLTLQWVPAHRVEIAGTDVFDPDLYYVIRPTDGWKFPFQPEQVFHWRGENPHDPRLGLSPLETLRGVIAEDVAMEAANVELAKSGLAGPAWIFRPLEAPEWSNPARRGFEEDLTNRLRKKNKTPIVLEEGMELRDFGVSPRDAQALEVRRWAIQKIAVQYGVPLGMVGLADDVKAAQSAFYADTLPPYCESFTRALNTLILVRHYSEPSYCFEFNLDEKLMGDERLKALTSASGRPVMLTNEARARLNLPPVDGGDELVTPGNVIVGDKPSPMVMPIQNPLKPSQEGDHRELNGNAPKLLPAAGTIEHIQDNGQVYKQLEVTTEPRRQADMNRQRRTIDKAMALVERYYARQRMSLQGKADKAEADSERWNRELATEIGAFARQITELEGGIYVTRLGGYDFDMRKVENYLQALAEGTAEGLNRVTQQDIEKLGLEDALRRASEERAALAGASIGTRVTVFARKEAGKQAPFPERRLKTWIPDTDRHADLGGASVPLDSDWGGIEPGSEPNCKCSISIE